MASFGIASNTSWSFFMDRDNGIFYEMLTYPMSRSQYLLGKVLFNVLVAVLQAAITILLAAALLGVPLRVAGWPLLALAMVVGTAGWFFFYAIFALRDPAQRRVQHGDVDFLLRVPVRQLDVLSARAAAVRVPGRGATRIPITWQVDVLRYLTIGVGDPATIAIESAAFLAFTAVTFAIAGHALRNQE